MENDTLPNQLFKPHTEVTGQFYKDVITGLNSDPKFLEAKYFYDAAGDKLFQEIMDCPEYYPTGSELEIFSTQTADLAKMLIGVGDEFDLIELGAGDATKSIYLLKELMNQGADFDYLPIDISENIIDYLSLTLPVSLPGIQIKALNGDCFEMLEKVSTDDNKRKVVLFLGANIGNMSMELARTFCRELRDYLLPGDLTLIGIDLKKSPKIVLADYNDAGGITKRFNLNLLNRINRELYADFDIGKFDHYPTYDPETGACKSYLTSLVDHGVRIGEEYIQERRIYTHGNLSKIFHKRYRKHCVPIRLPNLHNFTDQKNWFIDSIWVAV